MKENGMLITCDRCKETLFVKGEVKRLENGKEYIDTPMPEGWQRTPYGKDHCPRCAEEYNSLMQRFYRK